MATEAGRGVCGEDILSLSIGQAVYPENGMDAEDLLAEADRRMYLEKRKRPTQKNRRSHPRLRCRMEVELKIEGMVDRVPATLANISLGGCYVVVSGDFARGRKVNVALATPEGPLRADGQIVWVDANYGFAVQFVGAQPDQNQQSLRMMEFVENRTKQTEKSALSNVER